MERSSTPRLVGGAIVFLALVIGSWQVFGRHVAIPEPEVFRFSGVTGPSHVTVVPSVVPTQPEAYIEGSTSRMAILLTDPDSSWLGLAHGLKSIGIPFRITRDVDVALAHRVVLVYPIISGKVLSPESLAKLAAFPPTGGTLIGVQVVGGGLSQLFGFREATASRKRFDMGLASGDPLLAPFTEPHERRLRVGIRNKGLEVIGTYGYTETVNPLVTFEDGTAAVTQQAHGLGRAYAIGFDLGFLLLKGYNNRAEELVEAYDNQFDPTLDVWLRLLKSIYRAGQEGAVTLGTVPFGKSLSVLLTHDIDFTQSLRNAEDYAAYERSQGLVGTYFIQTKYVKDYNDDVYFNETGRRQLARLAELGVELGSHTVAHSAVLSKLPMGTGREMYPEYVPFVKDLATTYNGTILGELRISKYLIEHFSGQTVWSFRPGHLSNPNALPQALAATSYRYSSSTTANNSLTHLPYQLNYDRSVQAEIGVFEFPVTIEDEELPKMGDRLPQALAVARQISQYGGLCVVLIHPNILDHKLAFEKGFVEGVRSFAWFGSVGQFGDWWAARDQVGIEVVRMAGHFRVELTIPRALSGLTLEVPVGWQVKLKGSSVTGITQQGTIVTLPPLHGHQTVLFRQASPT